MSKYLIGKYSQKNFDYAKKPATDAFKTSSKRLIQKTVEATLDLIGNKIADNFTKGPKNSQKNNSETVTNKHDKEILKERQKKYRYFYI